MSNPLPLDAPEPVSPPDLFEVDPPIDVAAEVSRMIGDWDGVVADEEAIANEVGRVIDQGEPAQRWFITTDDEADWAMATLAAAAERLGTFVARRDAYIRRAERWFEHVSREDRRTVAFMDAHLSDYALRVREKSPRTKHGEPSIKTLRLVAGEVSTRGGGKPRVEILDKAQLIEWARKHLPDAVTTTYDVKVSDLRGHVNVAEVEVDGETVYTVQTTHDATIDVPFVEAIVPPVTATVRPQPIEE